eukprot:TRINITY_DN34522_c0_g1_i1.p1 TRINITY_DN34522_c0_g1~~TRINITY_DN34522_c0_g1_i1.p1  ORF type:complete len:181 (+),score=51.73 TRINITY_DN34522_c0_g1_i1:66-545(+)
MASNLRHVYVTNCTRRRVKANTALAEALDCLSTDLTALNVSGNYVGPEHGFECLLEVVKTADKLQELDVSNNYLTTENTKSLVDVLSRHPGIRTLRINNNRLYIDSGKELLRLVRHNRNVVAVETDYAGYPNSNKIPDKIRGQIQRELQTNMRKAAEAA